MFLKNLTRTQNIMLIIFLIIGYIIIYSYDVEYVSKIIWTVLFNVISIAAFDKFLGSNK